MVRLRQKQKGAATLETALVFSLFFALLWGILSYTLPFFMMQVMNHATSEATRAAVRADPALRSSNPAFAAMVGGAPLGHRFMWWNFVSSRKERIVQASRDWESQTMGQVPGDAELIPLPERRFTAAFGLQFG